MRKSAPRASATGPRRVGLFGGAFDPPHRAHRALAIAAVRQLDLDVLYIVPTGEAWHRPQVLAPGDQRFAMSRLAFSGVPRSLVDGRELRRHGPSYSIDTLRELQAEHPRASLFLVIGEDQAAGFARWHAWQDIAAMATVAVAGRPGAAEDGLALLRALPGVRVHALDLPAMPESATDIRTSLAAGQEVTPLVGAAVASYIEQHHLYRTP